MRLGEQLPIGTSSINYSLQCLGFSLHFTINAIRICSIVTINSQPVHSLSAFIDHPCSLPFASEFSENKKLRSSHLCYNVLPWRHTCCPHDQTHTISYYDFQCYHALNLPPLWNALPENKTAPSPVCTAFHRMQEHSTHADVPVLATEGIRKQCYVIYITKCIPIARKRLGKHINAQAKSRNNRTSVAKQWISKHTSLTTEAVFSAWSV
jgi:hypothetical protein